MASVRIGIQIDETVLDKLQPHIEAAADIGLLTEAEARSVLVDAVVASVRMTTESR